MQVPFMDFSPMHVPLKEEIIKKVSEVVSKGNFILGDEVSQFEKEFASYCGSRYCIGVASGSDALNLSIHALGLRDKEVVTVSNTFVATVDCIIRNNSVARFVDIDRNTLQMDTARLEKEITDKTKAIIPVDLFGSMPDWKHIKEIAAKHSLPIIEDACQAHGSKYDGMMAGRFGDLACFSFYPGKNLGAFGDGGAIVTDSEELRDKLLKLRNYGQSVKYKHDFVGFNSRLDTIQAAILQIKLRFLDKWVAQKRALAKIYMEELSKLDEIRIPSVLDETFHSYHLFPILVPNRDALQKFLLDYSISTGIHYPIPVHKQQGYQSQCAYTELGVTEDACSKILSLPMYPGMKPEQAMSVCEAVRAFMVMENS